MDFDKSQNKLETVAKIDGGPIFFSNDLNSSMSTKSIEERQNLSTEGSLIIALVLDSNKKALLAEPVIRSIGSAFVSSEEWLLVEEKIIQDIKDFINKFSHGQQREISLFKRLIQEIFTKRVREKFGQFSPVISIAIQVQENK